MRYDTLAFLALSATAFTGCWVAPPQIELPHVAAASPDGEASKDRFVAKCPDFSGTYFTSSLPDQTLLIKQDGCRKIAVRTLLPGMYEHNYEYSLDGVTTTVRTYYLHSVPFIAFFENDSLVFKGRGPRYTSVERWQLQRPDQILETSHAQRDSGRRYNEFETRYVRIDEASRTD